MAGADSLNSPHSSTSEKCGATRSQFNLTDNVSEHFVEKSDLTGIVQLSNCVYLEIFLNVLDKQLAL